MLDEWHGRRGSSSIIAEKQPPNSIREPEQVYGILVDTIGCFASLRDRHRDRLPAQMQTFLDQVDDASADYLFGEAEPA
jgi:hypothetical protein